MSLNQRIVDNIIAIFQDVNNVEKLSSEVVAETINYFYEGKTLHYMDHMVAAWDALPDVLPEMKVSNYIGFILTLPISETHKKDVQLDQLSNLIGVLTGRDVKLKTPIAETLIQHLRAHMQKNKMDSTIENFLSAMLLEYSDHFDEDRSNIINQNYVRAILKINQDPIFNIPEDGVLNMYHYMNGFMLTRASFSLFNVENKKPFTFDKEEIAALTAIEERLKDSTETNQEYHKSVLWNLALTQYVRMHNNIEELRTLYNAYPEKQQAWDEDLAIAKLSLYNSSEMSPS